MVSRGLILALLALLVCAGSAGAQTPAPNADLAAGNNQFAFDLYQTAIGTTDGNLLFSPFSISQALAMAYAGARGNTETQMAEALHFTLPQTELHTAFNALTADLNQRAQEEMEGVDGQRFQLSIANALWGQVGFPFLPEYTALLEANYGAGVRETDFASDPEAARQLINDWIAEQTQDKIQDIVPPGAVNEGTRLVLANAIYFLASWLSPFSEAATQDGPFTLVDGSTVTVPMMQQTEGYGYFSGEGYQAVELPYVGGDVSMVLLLPDEGTFADFEAGLNADSFAEAVKSLEYTEVNLSLPRFSYEFNLPLTDALVELGMTDTFDPNQADFSGMTSEPLFISEALHKAFIAVDESGTEAAAATVLMFETTALPARPIELKVDRPFIYAIYDRETSSVLFLGRVMNPAG